jgi:hypothetical protein
MRSCLTQRPIADFENQGSGRLVLKDPELKERTIGMTRPHLLVSRILNVHPVW